MDNQIEPTYATGYDIAMQETEKIIATLVRWSTDSGGLISLIVYMDTVENEYGQDFARGYRDGLGDRGVNFLYLDGSPIFP